MTLGIPRAAAAREVPAEALAKAKRDTCDAKPCGNSPQKMPALDEWFALLLLCKVRS